MIVYFADRAMKILGHASDKLENGYKLANDSCVSEVEHGTETLTFDLYFQPSTRTDIEEISTVGNYILRYTGIKDQYKLYTIIDTELDVNERRINIFAEDGGLDLLNETAGPYDPGKALTIKEYVNKYLQDTGFVIGKNEIGDGNKKYFVFDGDETVTARLLKIASDFEAEISYSYTISGLKVTSKKVDIYKRIGSDKSIELRTDREIDNIIVKKTISNLCSGIYAIGSSPDGSVGHISGKNSQGHTLYSWVRFADSFNGVDGFENSASDHNFIGIALNQTGYLESEKPSDYRWYRILYNNVIVVPDDISSGIQMMDNDGEESDKYIWVRFADDEYGTGIGTTPKAWIGIAKNKDDETPSSNAGDYEWDRYYGAETENLYLRPSSYRIGDGRYCHWKFSDTYDGSGGMYDTASHSRKYVGFVCTYDSNSPSSYTDYIWAQISGEISANGRFVEFDWVTSGLLEYDGKYETNPRRYTWIRFSKGENGSEMQYTSKSAKYIGFSYNHETVNPTNSASIYRWYDITGDNDKITLTGLVYDDGDMYLDNEILYSRKAISKWTRYKVATETGRTAKGAIVRRISYSEGNPDKLLELVKKDLKKYSEPEVNYEVSIHYLPENIFLGDRINIVDDAGLLYVSARILQITRSECNDTTKITLGDFLIKDSGINETVQKLANDFSVWAKANPIPVVKAEDPYILKVSCYDGKIFKLVKQMTLSATVTQGGTNLTDAMLNDRKLQIRWYRFNFSTSQWNEVIGVRGHRTYTITTELNPGTMSYKAELHNLEEED